jgi:(R)-citramalate synthase
LVHAMGLRPSATISLLIDGEKFEENAQGDGQFDAFMNALAKAYTKKNRCLPKLIDYAVRIAPGSSSDALCETIITWELDQKKFITRGLDSDQTVCAIKATQKMLNINIEARTRVIASRTGTAPILQTNTKTQLQDK